MRQYYSVANVTVEIDNPEMIAQKIAELVQEIESLEKINRFLEEKISHLTHVEESSDQWIKIEDRDTVSTVILAYSDPITAKILESIKEKPLTISEIIERTNLPQTTTYRKINELIQSKIIQSAGLFLNKDNKRVHSFATVIKHVRVYFEENEVIMFVNVKKNSFP